VAQSLKDKIIRELKKNPDFIFFDKDFFELGSPGAVRITLKRLCDDGEIDRLTRGLYGYSFCCCTSPSPTELAEAIARKFGWEITPSGETALFFLGISCQMPSVMEFISTGPYRSYEIGAYELCFKHASSKNFSIQDSMGKLVVLALAALGKDKITPEIIELLQNKLTEKEKRKIISESRYVTVWIHDFLKDILQ